MIKIAPSILSADFSCLGEQVNLAQKGGAAYLHIDVMDGHFVPNITLGPVVIASLRPKTDIVFDVHLMIDDPMRYIEDFAKAGADIITVHYEAVQDLDECIRLIKSCGKRAGVSIKPGTDVQCIMEYLDRLDIVLVMSVEPGFGGQKYMDSADSKLQRLQIAKAALKEGSNLDIGVDGGVNLSNLERVIKAGANVIVAGNAIFNTHDIEGTTQSFCEIANIAAKMI